MIIKAYKIFEERNGLPRALVHGHAELGKRTRMYNLDYWLSAEFGTPGFCCFLSEQDALAYLPKFTVRAPKLVISAILVNDVHLIKKERSNYVFSKIMNIEKAYWDMRK